MERKVKKTILYLHGFGSSGQSGTVKHLRGLVELPALVITHSITVRNWRTNLPNV